MKNNVVAKIGNRLWDRRHGRGAPQPSVRLVTDRANWALACVTRSISAELLKRHDLRCKTTHRFSPLWVSQLIHFGDRYLFFRSPYRMLAATNKLCVTWFHGDSDDPAFSGAFDRLRDAAGCLQRVVTSCSSSLRHLEAAGIPQEKLVAIPIGVDLATFTPGDGRDKAISRRKLGIPADARCIGSFQKDGNGWGEGETPKLVKGPDVFLEAMRKLRQKEPRLFVLLTGPSRGYVKTGLKKLGIPFLHQFVEDYADLVSYYHALDLYLITSRSEGGPMAFMESWACGVPVVSTAMGMPADWIRPGQNGLITEVGDCEGLAESALQFLQHGELREQCVRQAAIDVQQLSWSVVADAYYRQLYIPLLRGRAAA